MANGGCNDSIPEDLQDISLEFLQENDEEIDLLLSQVPSKDCFDATVQPLKENNKRSSNQRFGTLVSDEQIKLAQAAAVPANTAKATNWAVGVWKDWSQHRRTVQASYSIC